MTAPGAGDIRLLTCVGVPGDLALLGHFLHHYAALGVAPQRTHVILNAAEAKEPALGRARETLAAHGAPAPEVWIGAYSSAEMWRRRRELQARVPEAGDWILSADVDEFHAYPADLDTVLALLANLDATVLQGPLIDRTTRDGTLPDVAADRDPHEDFPLEAEIMCRLGKSADRADALGTVKMMLYRHDVWPGQGGHGPKAGKDQGRVAFAHDVALPAFPRIKEASFRFAQPFRVLHFKWHAGLVAAMRGRLAHGGASAAAQSYGDRVLDYLETRGGALDPADFKARPAEPGPADWRERLALLRDQGGALRRMRRRFRQTGPGPARGSVGAGWEVRQLTTGSARELYHAHSYYDLPVLDPAAERAVAYRSRIAVRAIKPDDAVTVGLVDVAEGGFAPLADTRAWSWQQGPMAQWLPDGRRLVWADREGRRFVARLHDTVTGTTRTLPRPIYAVDPHGRYALSLNMGRLNRMRPGYGFTGGQDANRDEPAPRQDGLWRIDLATGEQRLLLSLDSAVKFLVAQPPGVGPGPQQPEMDAPLTYWLNHPKVSPDGERVTVKLRWRASDLASGWNGRMGVSLTLATESPDARGRDLRLLARGTSHVMWWDTERLYFWQPARGRVSVVRDTAPGGTLEGDLFPETLTANVHMRHVPNAPHLAVYDTPYREEVALNLINLESGATQGIARFHRHKPPRGPFRCDLHPVLSADGRSIVVTSLLDGGRQLYLARHGEGGFAVA